MGSGKTSLGKLLARRLKFDFLDTDFEIETQEKCTIQEIFNTNGETYFRDKELEILHQISEGNIPTIFSTGGGMPIFNDNILLMKNKGLVVYLDVPIGMLHFRLKNDSNRPLLVSQENLFGYIEATLKERLPIYIQADLTVDGRLNKSELVEMIANFYEEAKFQK